MRSQFTLHFDGHFWIGVYEIHHRDGTIQAARHVFRAEPSDAELWAWTHESTALELIEKAHSAPRITPSSAVHTRRARHPKKVARLAAKEAARPAASTAAQEALARAREEQKRQATATRARQKEEEAQARYQQRVAKRRTKRRGH